MAFIPGTTIEQPGPQFVAGGGGAAGISAVSTPSPQQDQTAQQAAALQQQLNDIATALAALPSTVPATPLSAADQAKVTPLIQNAKNLAPQDQANFIKNIAITDPTLAQQVSSGLGIRPPQAPTQPPVGGTTALTANVQIANLQQKISNLSSEIKAGVFTGREALLGDLFKQFGIEEAQSSLNQFNQIILREQKRLEELPEAIRTTLADVGISQAQLDRLVVRDSEKILKQLNEAMRNAGATQDRINQSLKFVGLFFDAKVADQAAKLEAFKFDLETNKGLLKDLRADQKTLVDRALEERKLVLQVGEAYRKNGGTDDNILTQILSSASAEEANKILAQTGLGADTSIKENTIVQDGKRIIVRDVVSNATGAVISRTFVGEAPETSASAFERLVAGATLAGQGAPPVSAQKESGFTFSSIFRGLKNIFTPQTTLPPISELPLAIPEGYIDPNINIPELDKIVNQTITELGL